MWTHRGSDGRSSHGGAFVSAIVVSSCFPSFDVAPDAGALDARMDATTDVAREARTDAPADRARMDEGVDAAKCVPVEVATVPAHGGPACPMDGSTCFPGDVTRLSPQWVPPLTGTPHANACTTAQIADFYASCLGPGDTLSACNAFQSADATCFHCLATESTAPEYGPLIYYNGAFPVDVLNVAGCIALAEPCNLPCAKAALAYQTCALAACNPGGGPCNGATNTAILSCVAQAETACGCLGYTIPDDCYKSLIADPAAHPAVGLCHLTAAPTFDEASYSAIATIMCGPPS